MGANYYFEGTKLPTVQVSIPSIFGGSRTCFFGHALQVTNSIVWAVETPKKHVMWAAQCNLLKVGETSSAIRLLNSLDQ